ncbi:MAG: glycosyltransferase [Alloprevotella sp.]|nr:glycosyltransferase [Alloprevotella sp.]
MAKQPIKITVATVTYNAGALIAKTISSVEQQDYPAVEHLIIDGNSTDDTLEQIHRYMERNSVAEVKHEINCLSEPDNGIYDAMNKALSMATGRYIVFLNAGDTLHSDHTLSDVAALAEQRSTHPAVIYGHTDIVGSNGEFLRHRRLEPPEELSWHDFRYGMLVCHQAFYARTDIAHNLPYNMKYRFSADYDWTIRIMKVAEQRNLELCNARKVLADFLQGGTTAKNHRRSLFERLRIMGHHFGWATAIAEHFWFVVRAIIRK